MNLDRNAKLIRSLQSSAGVVHADQAEHEAQEDDEDIPQHRVPRHRVTSDKKELNIYMIGAFITLPSFFSFPNPNLT